MFLIAFRNKIIYPLCLRLSFLGHRMLPNLNNDKTFPKITIASYTPSVLYEIFNFIYSPVVCIL